MKKKVIIMLILLVLLCGIFGLIYYHNLDICDARHKCYFFNVSTSLESELKEKNVIVSNVIDLENFMKNFNDKDEILDKYDEVYFESKSLALIYMVTNNGCQNIKFKKLDEVDNTLKFKYKIQSNGTICEQWKNEYIYVIEIPKNIVKMENN
ncbi:MAG: hypothetical protein IJN90_07840 [Bacilli bacterium]|nr:hypothetical protein [Bacilli bacterium]